MSILFFSYSHADENLRDQLEKHLVALQRQGVISSWHDRRITAGTELADAIDGHLDAADVILLLISPDFIASDYCYDREMKRAMERHRTGDARVIPVILRPCDWKDLPFGTLLAYAEGRPRDHNVAEWRRGVSGRGHVDQARSKRDGPQTRTSRTGTDGPAVGCRQFCPGINAVQQSSDHEEIYRPGPGSLPARRL